MVALLSVVWYASDQFHDFFIHHQRDALASWAITVSQSINGSSEINENNCQVLQISDQEIRVTIINRRGVALCDAEVDPKSMENHAKRPEINKALAGQRSSAIRFSTTLQASMLYLAIPNHESEKMVTVVRTAISLASIDKLLDGLHKQFLILLVILLTVISFVMINQTRQPPRRPSYVNDNSASTSSFGS